jgi:hypothetical protein
MGAQTPNGVEFSIAAKIYLCAGRVFPAAGMMVGWKAPTGERVSFKKLTESMMVAQLDALVTAGYAQIWEAPRKQLIGSFPVVMVRAVYSGAPGFAGRMLEATQWQDTDFYELSRRIIGGTCDVPYHSIMDQVAGEFRSAAVLHGSEWSAEWLDYLVAQWGREAWDAVQHLDTLPWKEIARRNVSAASGSLLANNSDGIDSD